MSTETTPSSSPQTLVAVHDGDPGAVSGSAAATVTTSRGALILAGEDHLLNTARPICAGEFEMSVTLTLPVLDGSEASIVLAGDHHRPDEPPQGKLAVRLTLDGRAGQIYIEGERSDRLIGLLPRSIGLVDSYIPRGRPFTVHIRRVDGRLVIRIDDHTLFDSPCSMEYVGNVGLYPSRGIMLVYDFTIHGNIAEESLPQTDIWTLGDGEYASYRIPGLAATKSGTIIAFAEARRPGPYKGDVDIVAKRSSDGGATWSQQQLIWDPGDGPFFARDPSPVIDETTGTIHVLVGANPPLPDFPRLPGPQRLFILSSNDDGQTWSEPRHLDLIRTRSELAKLTAGPAAGIQLRHGTHEGRLVVPGYSVEVDAVRQHSCVVYSDDHGETWHLGGFGPNPSGESTVVELEDGTVMLNMRAKIKDENGNMILYRLVARSDDGGGSFGTPTFQYDLPDPNCQAHLVGNLPDGVLLYSGPHHTERSHRYNMSIKMSSDHGDSWRVARRVYNGYSAYSAIAALPGDRVGLLFERDDYAKLTFASFPLSWVADA